MIPKRVVFDTNVCLDLFVFKDKRYLPILKYLDQGSVLALTSSQCAEEWRRVLRYPQLPIQSEDLSKIEESFRQYIECIDPEVDITVKLPLCKDKDDQKFLEFARDVRADVLVSKDKAVLKLAKRILNLNLYRIVTPDVFLADLKTM